MNTVYYSSFSYTKNVICNFKWYSISKVHFPSSQTLKEMPLKRSIQITCSTEIPLLFWIITKCVPRSTSLEKIPTWCKWAPLHSLPLMNCHSHFLILLTSVAPNYLWRVVSTRNVTSYRKTKWWIDGWKSYRQSNPRTGTTERNHSWPRICINRGRRTRAASPSVVKHTTNCSGHVMGSPVTVRS
jgi:hypothetical protein